MKTIFWLFIFVATLTACYPKLTDTVIPTSFPTQTATPTPTPTETLLPSPTSTQPTIPTRSASLGTVIPKPKTAITVEDVDKLVELARWGKGAILEIAWSPDSKFVALATTIGVYLYDGELMNEIRFYGTSERAMSLNFSLDGMFLAAGLEDGSIKVWDLIDGHQGYSLILNKNNGDSQSNIREVDSVSFSLNSKLLASRYSEGKIKIWDLQSQSVIQEFHDANDYLGFVFFISNDVLSSVTNETVRMWNVVSGQELESPGNKYALAEEFAISQDGKMMAYLLEDKSIRIWDVNSNLERIYFLDAPTNTYFLKFSSSGKFLAALSPEALKIWDVNNGTLALTVSFPENYSHLLAISPDDLKIVLPIGGTLKIFQVYDGKLINQIEEHLDPISDIAISPDDSIIALAKIFTIELRNTSDGKLVRSFFTTYDESWDYVSFSSDGEMLITFSTIDLNFDFKSIMRIWRVRDGKLLRSWEDFNGNISPDARFIALETTLGEVEVINRVSGNKVEAFKLRDSSSAFEISFSPQSDLLAAWDIFDSLIYVWDIASREEILFLESFDGDNLSFSPDSSLLTTQKDGETQIWKIPEGRQLCTIQGLGKTFSPDGKLIASIKDGKVAIWDVTNCTELFNFPEHINNINGMSFSKDGSLLYLYSYDGTISVWGRQP